MTVALEVTLLSAGGAQHQRQWALRSAAWGRQFFPASVGLLRHPTEGWFLFDTGYAPRFLEATDTFPERLYRTVVPMVCGPHEAIATQLAARGIDPNDIRGIIISHFHGDHIAGLRDFPAARFYCRRSAYAAFCRGNRLTRIAHGFIDTLLPNDFLARCTFIDDHPRIGLPPGWGLFHDAVDLFQDQSMLVIDLPGHAPGQIGLAVTDQRGQQVFLVADACWLSESVQQAILPHPIVRAITHEWGPYQQTLSALHRLSRSYPDLHIIPSHCVQALRRYQQGAAC